MSSEPSEQFRGVVYQLLNGFWYTQTLYVVARLGIADHLAEGPLHVDELAERTKTHPETLYRLLRALAALGVFVEQEGRRFAQGEPSAWLREDVPGSLRPAALHMGEPAFWQTWERLEDAVREGRPAFDMVHGSRLFDFLGAHPESGAAFQQMLSASPGWDASIVRAYDLSDVRLAVDVGGGDGSLLRAALDAYPEMEGIVFDLPKALANAPAPTERCRHVAGDFFEAVPEGADVYLARFILHDWPDDDAVRILRTCRRAMRPESRFLAIENLLGAGPAGAQAAVLDLTLFVLTGGQERSAQEYEALFAAAGLRQVGVTATDAGASILEARLA